ncbi:MAG TPA: hypothetical protein VHO90_03950 [Bacteroidales bacterium]|nr:hypothetical protein [Bacteroidales bacterium]
MKTFFTIWGTSGKVTVGFKTTLLLLSFIVYSTTAAFSQTDKKAAEIKKLETALNTAKANLAKAEKQLAIADSLESTGQSMVTDGKSEGKSLNSERKKLDKDYAANRKPLDKQMKSKDKDEVTQAKTELKNLDTQYKADVKANDTKAKALTKKITTGEANMNKGKASKKTAEAAVKTAQAAVDAAQEKYDAATGASSEPEDNGGKKGKKK